MKETEDGRWEVDINDLPAGLRGLEELRFVDEPRVLLTAHLRAVAEDQAERQDLDGDEFYEYVDRLTGPPENGGREAADFQFAIARGEEEGKFGDELRYARMLQISRRKQIDRAKRQTDQHSPTGAKRDG